MIPLLSTQVIVVKGAEAGRIGKIGGLSVAATLGKLRATDGIGSVPLSAQFTSVVTIGAIGEKCVSRSTGVYRETFGNNKGVRKRGCVSCLLALENRGLTPPAHHESYTCSSVGSAVGDASPGILNS